MFPAHELKKRLQHVALEPGPAPQVRHFLFFYSHWAVTLLFFNSSFAEKLALELGPAPQLPLFFYFTGGDLGWSFRLAP